MRVLLKLTLNCDPDDAWRAIRNPAVFTAVSSPFTRFVSLEPGGFPDSGARAITPCGSPRSGWCRSGEQVIGISFPDGPDGVRLMRDSGRGVSGALAAISHWEHTMAVASAPQGRTLYRDQLDFGAGPLTILIWPVFWAFWQWRALGLMRRAPSWSDAASDH